MNLNDFLINRGRGRGRRGLRNKNYADKSPLKTTKVKRKEYTPSSDINWGQGHISTVNSSSIHKSAGSSKFSSEEDSRVVVALTEGRGEARCEVGLAAITVSKPVLILCQISDTQSYVNTLTKINILNPQEIIVPLTFVESFSGNRLIDKIREHFPRIKYTGCPRSTFSKANGVDVLSNLCVPCLNAILLVLQHRYYALAAASALITYVQDSLFVYYAAGSVKIDYQESEGYAIIDVSTADKLELVCSTKPAQGNKYASLFGVLNHCMTKIGSRTLRSSILQPPCKIQYIEERLSAIAELIKHPEMLLSIQALLQKVSNIDMLLSVGTLIPEDPQNCSNRQLNYILLVNGLIDLVAPLREVLTRSRHPFFVQLTATLASKDLASIKDIVRSVVQENAQSAKGEAAIMQRCFAIKPGINGLLDLLRKTYSERLDDMREYVKKLAQKYDLPLTLSNNQTKGRHIVLSLNPSQKRYMKKSDLPEEFIEVYRLVGSFTMKTPELVNLSTRLDDIMADILKVSNIMVHSIIVEIKNYVPLFYKLCEEIAHLDLLQSLAECSVRNGYVRPKFGTFTEVTFAHHPLLDFLLSTKPVPNPISYSSDYNVHIITGPNGSGKSIFIRQVMLLQVMAQVGCYVPAQTAIFRPADRMYARIYLEDNMEHGASTFILEMKELKYIMMTMTENSLVIIDELCRSTSLEEGTALAIAMIEKLAQSSAFIFFTTHFTLLTKLYDMYLNVKVWHLETLCSGDDPKSFQLDFRHNLIPGVTTVKRYGVYIVRNIWPDSIVQYVNDLLDKISSKPKDPKIVAIDEKIRLKYKIESECRKLKSQQKLTLPEINKLLNQYQNELEKLGYNLGDNVERSPRIEHSIFGDVQNLAQQFTPGPFLSSQTSADLEAQKTMERMQAVFTPEQSQDTNCMNQSCPNLDFYQNDEGRYERSVNENVSYENLSRFIAEDSENIQKLIPEVNISHAETPRSSSVANMNEFQFSVPLQSDAGNTSTPMVNRPPELVRSASPIAQIYGADRRNFTTSTNTNEQSYVNSQNSVVIPEPTALDGYDMESIREELEVCSRIFTEEDDDFEGESFDTTYKSIPASCDVAREKSESILPKEKYDHIYPVVTVVEGPNNTTSSFDEDADVPKCREDLVTRNKIRVISDVLVVPPRKEEAVIEEEDNRDNTSIGNEGTNPVRPSYKSFDSTFDAGVTMEESDGSEEFRSFADDDSKGCEFRFQPGSPARVVTKPSPIKITYEENNVEANEAINEHEQSSQNRAETTSVSCASKLRKLDQNSTTSSPPESNEKTSGDKTTTSLSSASKKRNLDQGTTDSPTANEKSDKLTSASSSLKESDEGKSNPETRTKTKRANIRKGKFIPPRRLTAKAIREEFEEQTRKIVASSSNSPNASKYLQQLINRPSVKQLKNATHVATVRKTEEGVEVIPARPPSKKPKTTPWKRQFLNENFGASIFSDENALPFESYLSSKEKNYDAFRFNFDTNQGAGEKFEFAPTMTSVGEYTSNSVVKRFMRTVSEARSNRQGSGLAEEDQNGTLRVSQDQNVTFRVSQQTIVPSLTPDGFYKRNKDDIRRIVDKYLRDGDRNIFDTNDIDSCDLNL